MDNSVQLKSAYIGEDIGKATVTTETIQASIDACAESGGGGVRIPPGRHVIGTIVLKDNVTLYLEAGARLVAAPDLKHFPAKKLSFVSNFHLFFRHALVFADGAKNIGICGSGVIDGNGAVDSFRQRTFKTPRRYQNRPSAVRFVNCTNVRVENITIKDSAFWSFHLLACGDVVIHGVTIRGRSPNYNVDGIDIDCCENVRIADCCIDSEDDAICIKSTGDKPTKRITVTNCILSSHCNAIRFGAENIAGFEDISVTNCQIFDSGAGITFQNADGAHMRRIMCANMTMHGVAEPFYMINTVGSYPIGVDIADYPCPPRNEPGVIEDIVFSNILATEIGRYRGTGPINKPAERFSRSAAIFSSDPRAPVRNLTIEGLKIRFMGGGTREDAALRLGDINTQFNSSAHKVTPSYGLFLRHIANLRINHCDFSFDKDDCRPAIIIKECKNPALFGVAMQLSRKTDNAMLMSNVDGLCMNTCFARADSQWRDLKAP
jgi:hypothetical protein